MNKPKMIMFDYGQTLVSEGTFSGEAGIKAVLKHARINPYQISAKVLHEFAKELNRDIGRYDFDIRKSIPIEVHNHMFQNYLYQYYGIEFDLSSDEMEKVFWDNASDKNPTKNIERLLKYLQDNEVRTAVISNITFSGNALKERLHQLIPDHEFEFIVASSEYVFRKPHPRIYELALKKAGLAARDVWYCGDDAYVDVEGAYKVGIYPIWYRGEARQQSHLVPEVECLLIHDWIELMEVLNQI